MRGVIRRELSEELRFIYRERLSGLIVTVMAMRSRSYQKIGELSEILDGYEGLK